jgi:hypothetical protein
LSACFPALSFVGLAAIDTDSIIEYASPGQLGDIGTPCVALGLAKLFGSLCGCAKTVDNSNKDLIPTPEYFDRGFQVVDLHSADKVGTLVRSAYCLELVQNTYDT